MFEFSILLGVFCFFYYMVSMCVGISIMDENVTKTALWKGSSSIYKIWNWLLIPFLWVPFVYTPIKIILFLVTPATQRHFFAVLMSTFKKEATL